MFIKNNKLTTSFNSSDYRHNQYPKFYDYSQNKKDNAFTSNTLSLLYFKTYKITLFLHNSPNKIYKATK